MKNCISAIVRWGTIPIILFSIILSLLGIPQPVYAAGIDVQPLTWNIIGLDSNKPTDGPNHFPVGARVCNNTGAPISNVKADFIWDNTTNSAYIFERPGTDTSLTMFAPPDLALIDGACADFYFEVEVSKVSAAYNKTRRYHIDVTSTETGAAVYSTPRPRELFVEYLVSQSRNAVTDVQYGTNLASLASVPNGGAMSLLVGQTYYIRLVGFTATQGYNQLESFINFPNTIFRVLSVDSIYSAPSAGYTIDKMYSDACGWDNVISSPTYRSCIVSDDKSGGDISVTYQVQILSVPGGAFTNPEPLSTLIYDFSGSSYHYNADFGISTRYAYVFDPASVDISKSFTPSTVAPGSTSTLTFTLTNTASVTVNGVSFNDNLPLYAGGQMVVAIPATYSTSGCGSPTFSPTAGGTSLSLSDGTIAPNGTCTVSVSVSVPDAPTTGAYPNISDNVFVSGLDSGHNATADLTIDAASIIPGAGLCGQTLATWNYTGAVAGALPTPYDANILNVATAQMTWGNGLTVEGDPSTGGVGGGNPIPGAKSYGWLKFDPIDPDTSPYIQFAIDTSQHIAVQLRFDVQRKSNGPSNDVLYYSTNGTTWTSKSTFASTVAWGSYPSSTTYYDFSGQTSTTGLTYFRIYGNGANATSSGNDLSMDNILFTGCGEPVQPALEKSFSPNPVVVGGTSTLTFTIDNSNSAALTDAKFTDTLPAGLEFDTASSPSTTCGGSPSMVFIGNTTFDFGQTTGATIPPGGCSVSIDVTATTAGPHQNISGFIYTAEGGTNSGPGGSGTASLTAVLPPTIEKVFNPNTILPNETSTLIFTITNPNPSDALPNVAFSDTLPAGMTLAADVTTPQCGGTVTGVATSDTVGFSGGTVAAGGNCTITVEVTASTLGDYVNTSDPVTTTIGGLTSGTDTATATLTVEAPNPSISILKRVSTSPTGPWSTFLTVTPATPVYYQFTVENTGDVDLDTVSVSDPILTALGLDLSGCAWATLPRYSDAITCVTASTPALAGNNPNTATAQGTYTAGGASKTAISSASYVGVTAGALNLSKQISTSLFGPWSASIVDVAPGSTVYYKFTIVNATGGTLTSINVTDVDPAVDTTVCTFTDPLPNNGATTCVVSATVSSTSVAKHTNTATAHGIDAGSNPVDSSPSSADYTPTSPDLTVTKSNDASGAGAIGTAFTWIITVANNGTGPATFSDGQTILSDPLPAGPSYTNFVAPVLSNLSCALTAAPDTITCMASGGDFNMAPGDSFDVAVDVTPTSDGGLLNTVTVDPGSNIMENEEGNNEASDTVTVVGVPSIAKVFLDNPIAAGGTSTLRFTITNPNASQDLSDVAFSDTLPTGMTLAADVTTPQCGGTVTGIAGTGTVSLTSGTVPANGSCTVDVSVTVAAGGNYVNTSGNVSSTNGGMGNTATATLNVFEAAKSIVSTSEASTGFKDPFERVAVGEIIRYRLTTTVPEGTWNDFQIVDAVDTGIQFLNDATATVSFVCDSACNNSAFAITPGIFSSSTDPTFDLGTVVNPDTDAGAEYLILEFNALVLNMTSNVAGGLTRDNSYTVSTNGITITSPSVGIRIVEPSISNFTKSVSPAVGPYYPGDTITYTLTYSNDSTGVNRAAAFEVFVTDSLNVNLDLQSVSVTTPISSTTSDTSTLGVAGVVRVLVDQVPPAADIAVGPTNVTITVFTQIVNTAPSGTVPNTAKLTYTSLPGGVTTGDANGTCPNVTGSCSPASSLLEPNIGERNGTGVAPNDYNDTATLDITVTNRIPVANPDTNTATEDGPAVTGNVLDGGVAAGDNPDDQGNPTANVTSASQGANPITVGTAFTTSAGGNLTLNADGTYSYTPPAWDDVPPGGLVEVFNYTITDADGDTSSTTLTITVTDNDRLPVADADTDAAVENGPAVSGDVLANETSLGDEPTTVTGAVDDDGDALTIGTAFTTDGGGSLMLNADGTYNYTPPTWNLVPPAGVVEVFTYTIMDADGDSDTTTLTITVTDNDRLPVATDNSYTIDEGSTASGNLMTDGTPDTPGDAPTTVTSYDATSVNGGTVTVAADGSFTYDPNGYTGVDMFTYTITDTDGDTSAATVTITVNALPNAVDNSTSTLVDTPVTTANVLTNDDLGDTPTTITAFDATSANGGTVTDNGDGTFDYNPPLGFTGTDTFTYTITDANGDTSTATVSITVTDLMPVATGNSYTIDEGSTASGNVMTDGTPDTLGDAPTTVTAFDATSANGGTVTVAADGSFTYDPAAGFTGTDTFDYTITDVNGDPSTATVTITVNALPQAVDDSASTLMDTPVTTPDVLINDDQGDAPATITAFDAASVNGGTVTDNGDGTFDYDPPLGYTGTDTFTYTITDNNGDTSTATVTVTVLPNNPPIATDNEGAVDITTPTHIANMVTDDEGYGVDSDPEGDPLPVTGIDGVTNPALDLTGTYGTLDWAADGSYTYTLNTSDPDFLLLPGGTTATDTFTYTISDGKGGTDTALIIITITGADDAPVANDDSFTILEDTILNDDLGPDHGSGADVPSADGGNVWSVVTAPAHGTVTVNPDGTFTYTPDAGYNGPDSFTYQVCDVDNDCDPATVNLTITNVEDPAIGIAKRVAQITRVGSGTFEVTFELSVENFGDVALSNVQVTDDLSATFPAPSTFTVQSVTISGLTNATLTANPGYNGSTDTNLLTPLGNTLSVNGNGTITVVARVVPSSSGPFDNSASANGETPTATLVTDDSSDGTDPDNTSSCPLCVNGDGDPTNNTKPTPITFDPNIFDPPFGFKELDASGLPVLRWTMIWINDNNFPSVAAVSDPIPVGTSYEVTGASSGYAVPGGAPVGSSNLGVSCGTDSAVEPAPSDAETTTISCYYEGPTSTYPRGRIVWEGLLGPDWGATDQANANDELYITFTVRVASGATTVQNVATIDADLNNDADRTDPGEQVVATARAAWQEPVTPPEGREGKKLPGTGFAPGKVTTLPKQAAEQAYADLGDLWLEIPSLGVKTPIVGVPKNAGVWDVDWLWEQAGWLQGTAFPTWQGNSVLTAHVYLPNGKPGPFIDLSKLRFGNQAIVHAFGQRYVYEIRTNHTILPTDMSPFKHEEKAWLTLLTCKGYDENTDSYKYRVEVRAVLLKIEAER